MPYVGRGSHCHSTAKKIGSSEDPGKQRHARASRDGSSEDPGKQRHARASRDAGRGQWVPPSQYSQRSESSACRAPHSTAKEANRLPAARLRGTRCPSSALRSRSGSRRLLASRPAARPRGTRLQISPWIRSSTRRTRCVLTDASWIRRPQKSAGIVLPSQTSLSHGVYAGHHDADRPIGRSVRWTPLTIPLQLQRALLRPLCAHVVL
jgi:hypothetical protein